MVRSRPEGTHRQLLLATCSVDLSTGLLSGEMRGRLTERERALLAYLADRPLEVVPRDEIAQVVFGYAPTARTRAVDKAMYSLRRKVERAPDAPEHLLTSFGEGYQFVPLERLSSPSSPAPLWRRALIGRQEEIGAVLGRLASEDLVTVRGPVGVGKSALAREVYRRWCDVDEALWCDVGGSGSLVEAVAAALGLLDIPRESLQSSIIAGRLRGRPRLLVVLDDADGHLEEFGAVEQWRAALPGVRWLVTARGAPALRGGQEVVLAPLSVAPASRLFAAWAAEHGQIVPEEAARALVARFDGLPLAIELAAARLPTFGLGAMSDPDRSPLDLVEGRPLAMPSRHCSLRAALSGPFMALDSECQRVLSEMSVFDAPVGLAQIESVLREPAEASLCGALDRLEAASWIQRSVCGGDVKLGLLHVIRAFAAEQLARSPDRARLLRARAGA